MLKVLFYTNLKGGVKYHRIESPAVVMQNMFPDEIFCDVKSNINWYDEKIYENIKQYDIIWFNGYLVDDTNAIAAIYTKLKCMGITLIQDVDDLWTLDKNLPTYEIATANGYVKKMETSMKFSNYITTTNNTLKSEIEKLDSNKKVLVFPNAVSEKYQSQFKPNKSARDTINIGYIGAASHKHDISILEGVVNRLYNDLELKGKFKIVLGGWNNEGINEDVSLTKEFIKALAENGCYTRDIVKQVVKHRKDLKSDLGQIKDLSYKVVSKFKDKTIFEITKRELQPREIVYRDYERILTDGYNIIKDKDYLQYLKEYRSDPYEGYTDNYERIWSLPTTSYATILDNVDILLAPLADTKFNKCKSNLKQVEAYSRNIVTVCSDIEPYNEHCVNGQDTILIPNKKNQSKLWYRELKKLILDNGYREKIAASFNESFKTKFDLENVTKLRYNFLMSIKNE